MCWSVPWPGAVEDEGLTRVPSAVCVTVRTMVEWFKEASIAGLFGWRGISGSTVAHKSIFFPLSNGGGTSKNRLGIEARFRVFWGVFGAVLHNYLSRLHFPH